MNTLRTTVMGLVCALGLGTATVSADSSNDGHGWMPHHGHMAMMGHGGMMGPGYGGMMGPGAAWTRGGAGMDPDRLSDEHLDHIGKRIAARHELKQEIAAEQDATARRELVREYLKTRHAYGQGERSYDDEDSERADHGGHRRGGMMAPGMMAPGMMAPGMMAPGMMAPGMMAPGMMAPGMMAPGMMAPGMMPPGMMTPGMMGPGHGMMGQGSAMMSPGGAGPGGMSPAMMGGGQLSDEHLDRIGEQMAERHKVMQQLAETSDKAERRRLLREHFESMHEHREGMD